MMDDAHHAIRALDLREQCPYCRDDVSELPWKNHFEGKRYYKAITCNCGAFLTIPLEFFGSGHTWGAKLNDDNQTIRPAEFPCTMKTIESKIQILSEKPHGTGGK